MRSVLVAGTGMLWCCMAVLLWSTRLEGARPLSVSDKTGSTTHAGPALVPGRGNGRKLQALELDSGALLQAHNQVRANEGAELPDLYWDDTVAASAQGWADDLASRGCPMEHSSLGYGENLMWFGGTPQYWAENGGVEQGTVNSWAGEKAHYDYSSNTCAEGQMCGHYTQVVWKNTEALGCGAALCPEDGFMVVCQYSPPGNMEGEWPY